jgi:serine/threonine protein phosphatase PrpC
MAGTVQPFVKIDPSPFECGAATHVGKVRSRNEDNFLVHPGSGIWVVADGMGGHQDGDIASKMIVEALQAVAPQSSAADLLTRCEASVLSANRRIQLHGAGGDQRVIGSTVAILLIHQYHYACLWSGDSRIYRLRDGELVQLSRDHTQVQELIESGQLTEDEAKNWPGRNVITRAVGVKDEPELDVEDGSLIPGDVFLLCSDGLTNHVSDREILAEIRNQGSQGACDALVRMTLARGARDNVTVVVVRYAPKDERSGSQQDVPEQLASDGDPSTHAFENSRRQNHGSR